MYLYRIELTLSVVFHCRIKCCGSLRLRHLKLSLTILIQKSKTPNRVILFCLYMNSIIMSSVKTRATKIWFHVRFYWFLRAQHLSVKNGGGRGSYYYKMCWRVLSVNGWTKVQKNLRAGLIIMTPIPSLECRFFDDNYWF